MKRPRPLKYIAVDGPIGAGKTTLVKMLAEDLGGKIVLEPVEKNPFLGEFYNNRQRNAFKTQLFFLLNRFQQQSELKQHDLFYPLIVCDYTFAKDFIFAELNLSDDELNLYNSIYKLLAAKLPQPDLVIYLRADSHVLLQRVKKRGHDYEKGVDVDYLEHLTEAYNRYFLHYAETPLLVVDSSSVNYAENPTDFANVKREILNHRGGTAHLIARS